MQDLTRVWTRMQSFPYIVEIAAARENFDALTLQGETTTTGTKATLPSDIVSKVHYRGWHENLRYFTEFRLRDKRSPGIFEHLAQIFVSTRPTI